MSVRRSLAWAFSGQIASAFIQFGGSVVIARLLSPGELGIYAIAMAAVGIVQVFATFGVAAYLVREAELAAETVRTAFTVNALLALGLTIALTGVSFVSAPLLGTARAGTVLRLIALGNLLGTVSFLPLAMMQREMQFRTLSAINTASATVQTLVTISCALAGASYRSPAFGSLASAVTTAALAVLFGGRHLSFRLSVTGWRPITTFGLQILSINGVGILNGRISDLLVGRLLGIPALGMYSRSSSLSNTVWENVYGTATRVIFPKLSQDYRTGADWRGTYLHSFAVITSLLWPVQIGLAVLAGPAVRLLYGERWTAAAGPLSALMVAQAVGVGFGMNWELFVLRGETGRQGRYEAVRMALGLPVFAVGCLFSITAAGLAKIADALIGLALYYPHVRRLADLGPREIPTVFLTSGSATLFAVLPAILLMTFHRWSYATPLPLIAAAVLAGIVLWLAAVIVSRHPLRDEIMAVRGKLFGRAAAPR